MRAECITGIARFCLDACQAAYRYFRKWKISWDRFGAIGVPCGRSFDDDQVVILRMPLEWHAME
jgi:hypothetical protein